MQHGAKIQFLRQQSVVRGRTLVRWRAVFPTINYGRLTLFRPGRAGIERGFHTWIYAFMGISLYSAKIRPKPKKVPIQARIEASSHRIWPQT